MHDSQTFVVVSKGTIDDECYISNRFPTSIVNVRFEFPADVTRDAMAEPQITDHRVVSLLVEVQLAAVA
jgi:hypothetical protein